ncbi:ATP-dependent RNA helicase CHR1 [Babesia ovata]|uniref:RNA helicase n=1 Tax=Babesia ovata TaxID=189622 RepID=A0A2H6KH33_9APIC|nr:ATP-dependent RNA helicase CHR1 [Babesia ovata]GBE62296.1 ATP-dependent RNA helicase CHR1 [Babesia ovata]
MGDIFAKLASYSGVRKSPSSQRVREKVSFDQELAIADSHGDAVEGATRLATFDELRTLSENSANLTWLIDSLHDRLKLSSPSPVQASVIPFALKGDDVFAVAPTGSGKTLAYLIPILLMHKRQKAIQSLVLVPTVELVNQVTRELVYLVGDNDVGILPLDPKCSQFEKEICISTPATMLTALKKRKCMLSKLEMLVVDEADVLFDGGYARHFDSILASLVEIKGLRKMLFSSTMQQQVLDLAASFMPSAVHVSVGQSTMACKNIRQELICVTNENGKVPALRQLIREGRVDLPCLVFLQSVERVGRVYSQLKEDNLLVDRLTGRLAPAEREELINKFRLSKIWVLLCTNILARGLDFRGIGSVVNFDIPLTAQDYVNRIGRSGRGETSGSAVTLFTLDDINIMGPVLDIMRRCNQEVPEYLLRCEQKKANVKRPPNRQSNESDRKRLKHRRSKVEDKNKTKANRKQASEQVP